MPLGRLDEALFLSVILDAVDDAIVSSDDADIVTSWNAAAERLFGFAADEMIGRSVSQIIPEHLHDEHEELRRTVLSGRTVHLASTERRHRDGTRVAVALTLSPIRDNDRQASGIAAILRDIADRDRTERAARRLAAIVQSSDDAIISKDLNGIVTSWNTAAEQMFGYSATEMIGASIRRIIPADRQSEEDHVLSQIRQGLRVDHFETIRQRKNGTLLPISLTISPIVDGRGAVIGASKIARDISDRKHADAERARLLRAAQTQAAITRTLNDVGTVVASALDRDSIVQSVTDAARHATGAEFGAFFYNVAEPSGGRYAPTIVSGTSSDALRDLPHPQMTAIFAATFQGEGIVRLDDVTKDARYLQGTQGQPSLGPVPVRSYLAVPVRARSGDVLGGLVFGHSAAGVFTVQHEEVASGIASWASVALENARLYVEAQEANRLKDEFLATLSHELRTPLNAILGYARMLRGQVFDDPEKQVRAVTTIERNAAALAHIVNDVLDVSRIISGKIRLQRERVNLTELVRYAVDAVMPSALEKRVQLSASYDCDEAYVDGDVARLQQVLWNIASNAVKFTDSGGQIDVALTCRTHEAEITVADTGIGMPRDFLPRAFDRFSQHESGPTRERGGLGLGLSISRDLVELHGGRIEAVSAGVGRGTTFRIVLPLVVAEDQTAAKVEPRSVSA
jgi:PAS domain S-box-containing protein